MRAAKVWHKKKRTIHYCYGYDTKKDEITVSLCRFGESDRGTKRDIFYNYEIMKPMGLFDRKNQEIFEYEVLEHSTTKKRYIAQILEGKKIAVNCDEEIPLIDIASECEVIGNMWEVD